MTEPRRVTPDDFNDIPSFAEHPLPPLEQSPFADNGDEPYDEEDSWEPINLAELPAQPPVQPTLGGMGLVYPGKRHVFSGPQESAKTLAAYAVGIEVVRQGGVLIVIDFEMGAYDARDRLRELGATDTDLASLRYIEPAEPAHLDTAQKLLEHEPQLVIVDAAAGAYDMQGLDDNKRADVEKFTTLYVRTFWRAGVATIVLDHVVKQGKERGNYAIGSERKVGGADVHLGFEVITPIKRGGHGVYKIVTHKDRPGFLKRGKLADLELKSDQEHNITWEIKQAVETEEQFRPTHLMEKVSKYLEGQAEPVSRNNVETHLGGKAEFIRKALDVLIAERHVVEVVGPRRARIVTLAHPYSEANDTSAKDPNPHEYKRDEVPSSSDQAPNSPKTASIPADKPKKGENSPALGTSSHFVPSSSGRGESEFVSSSPPTGGRDELNAENENEFVPPHDDIPF